MFDFLVNYKEKYLLLLSKYEMLERDLYALKSKLSDYDLYKYKCIEQQNEIERLNILINSYQTMLYDLLDSEYTEQQKQIIKKEIEKLGLDYIVNFFSSADDDDEQQELKEIDYIEI